MRTVAIINQKGGCGKTTTSINLAAVLAASGQRTLLVDLDPQSHCAAGLGVPEPRIDMDIGDALRAPNGEPVETERLLWPVSRNLDLAPSRMSLAGLEAVGGGLLDRPDKEQRLRTILGSMGHRYDICLIDCSPSIGLLTFNALVASDAALVPVETSFFSLQGATKQLSTVRSLSRHMDREIKVWLVPTLHDIESSLCEDLLDELRRRFGSKVVPSVIRRDMSLKEAASFGQPVIEYDNDSKGAHDYRALGAWVLEQLPSLGQASTNTNNTARDAVDPVEPAPGQPVVTPSVQSQDGLARKVMGAGAELAELQDRARALAQKLAERSSQAHAGTPQVANTETARRLFGARQTTSGVLFVQPLTLGKEVCIVGDFNNWSPTASPMRRNEAMAVWELIVRLDPGEHRYRLVVDGHWLADPYNSEWQLDSFGHPNSMIRVNPAPTVQGTVTSTMGTV